MQNVCGLNHLHHEGGLTGVNFVLRANARENSIYDANARARSRHTTAHLRQQHAKRHLPQESTLAGHVWPGQNPDALRLRHAAIVGHKALPVREHVRNHGMPATAQLQHILRNHLRAHKVMPRCHLAQGQQRVQLRQRARGSQQCWRLPHNLRAYFRKQPLF